MDWHEGSRKQRDCCVVCIDIPAGPPGGHGHPLPGYWAERCGELAESKMAASKSYFVVEPGASPGRTGVIGQGRPCATLLGAFATFRAALSARSISGLRSGRP